MSNEMMKNWSEYKPTKIVWLWSCVGTVALTMIVGFTGAGWVTSGTAAERAQVSTEQAVATLAAGICANRFLAAEDANAKLATLKEMDSWKRDTFIEEGGWVTFASMKQPVDGAAELCASQLAAAELPGVENGA
ncbi:MAG TPA: hypothetical protein VIP51_06355 [Eoetvoesiella sp.]